MEKQELDFFTKKLNDARKGLQRANIHGEWNKEPDRVDFRCGGFPCLVQRNMFLAWCGYVGVPKGHPAYRKHYDKIDVNVHGGVTYADGCMGAICHTPNDGETDDVWWVGFDCAHAGDLAPTMKAFDSKKFAKEYLGYELPSSYGQDTYKNLAYVKHQTRWLAKQLKEMT